MSDEHRHEAEAWRERAQVPYATAALPGTGGVIKRTPEHFKVDELEAYAPSGEGPHLYIRLEKRGVDARRALKRVAKAFGCAERDVGQAGNKDRQAVTRQWVSVLDEARAWSPDAAMAQDLGEGLRVVEASRHTNKLKTGHLKGNRFELVIAEVNSAPEEALEAARAILAHLARRGVPNAYGEQRFGRQWNNVITGLAVARGGAALRLNRFARRMAASALQSALFNANLAQRMREGWASEIVLGDRARRVGGGATFEVEDVAEVQGRFDAGEVVHTGPMFGPRMTRATGRAGALEEAVLAEAGLTVDDFRAFGKLAQGTRRDNLIFPQDVSAHPHPEGVRVCFALPPGAYATVVLDELIKPPRDALDPPRDEAP